MATPPLVWSRDWHGVRRMVGMEVGALDHANPHHSTFAFVRDDNIARLDLVNEAPSRPCGPTPVALPSAVFLLEGFAYLLFAPVFFTIAQVVPADDNATVVFANVPVVGTNTRSDL